MQLRFLTWRLRPPHRVTVRIGSDRDVQSLAGLFRDSMWVFTIPDGSGNYRLVLDGQVISDELFHIVDAPVIDLRDGDVHFPSPPIAIDDGRLQQAWFATSPDTDGWDVVVVGSGMGGGILLSALSELGTQRVLGLEAGSMLFPTHCGNLPRVTAGATVGLASSLWSAYDEFGTSPFAPEQPGWGGREMYAFGGRSLVWGGLCPMMSAQELGLWPRAVSEDLAGVRAGPGNYYQRAAEVLRVSSPASGNLQNAARELLQSLYCGMDHLVAPVAMRREPDDSWRVPGGLFSTAQLLLERRLASRGDRYSFGAPYLHLGEVVVRINPVGSRWRVHTVDLRDGSSTTYDARRVVLACGTVETPRIMFTSGLNPSLVGQGLTEHPMAWVHFEIPTESRFHDQSGSAKIISRPRARRARDDWMLQLELGADLNLAPHTGAPNPGTQVTPGSMAGQMVFLGRCDLGSGSITGSGDPPWLNLGVAGHGDPHSVQLHLDEQPRPPMPPEWSELSARLGAALGARPLQGSSGDPLPALQWSRTAFVAHTVGTMRMPTRAAPERSVVDTDLQVLDLPGLYVCDLSVFPTSPAANPSLTLAALALRLADHLVRR